MDQYVKENEAAEQQENENVLPKKIPPLNSEVGEFLKDLSEYLKDVGASVKRESTDVISAPVEEQIEQLNGEIKAITEAAPRDYEKYILDRDYDSANIIIQNRDQSYNQILNGLAQLCRDITIETDPQKYGGFIERGKDLFINAGGTEDEFKHCEINRNSVYNDTYNEEANEPNRKNMFAVFAERLGDYVYNQLQNNKQNTNAMDAGTKNEINGLANDIWNDYTIDLNSVEDRLDDAKDGEDYKQIKALSEDRKKLIQEKIQQLNNVADSLKNDSMGFTEENGSVYVDQLLSFAKQLDVMDRRASHQDERDAKEIMKKLGVKPEEYNDIKPEDDAVEVKEELKPNAQGNDDIRLEQDTNVQENGIHSVLGELANNLKRAVEGPEKKPDAQKNDNNIRLDDPVIEIVQHNGNIKLEQPVAEASPDQIFEARISKDEIDIFKKHLNNLEKAKTFKNSDEYKKLIDEVSDMTKADDIPMVIKANAVASAIKKYLGHKSKDGVKSNVFKKLAAVEALSKDVDKLFDKLEQKEKKTRSDADFSSRKTDIKNMYKFADKQDKRKYDKIIRSFTRDCDFDDFKRLDGTQLSMEQKRKVSTAMNDADMCMKKILLGAMKEKNETINDLVWMKNKFHEADFAAKEFGFSLTKAPKEQGLIMQ